MAKLIGKTILAVIFVFGAFAQTADVAGTWMASFDTQVGKQEYTYTFKLEGGTLTGTAKGNLITDSAVSDAKIEGNTITFVERGSYMGMPLQFNYMGEIVGNEIRFKRELMGFPAEEFVAKRSQ